MIELLLIIPVACIAYTTYYILNLTEEKNERVHYKAIKKFNKKNKKPKINSKVPKNKTQNKRRVSSPKKKNTKSKK